jgi:hypothetical protein
MIVGEQIANTTSRMSREDKKVDLAAATDQEIRTLYAMMCLSIIILSVKDIRGETICCATEKLDRDRIVLRANRYLFEYNSMEVLSFLHFCDVFDVDPEGLRSWCRDAIAGRVEVPPMSMFSAGQYLEGDGRDTRVIPQGVTHRNRCGRCGRLTSRDSPFCPTCIRRK